MKEAGARFVIETASAALKLRTAELADEGCELDADEVKVVVTMLRTLASGSKK